MKSSKFKPDIINKTPYKYNKRRKSSSNNLLEKENIKLSTKNIIITEENSSNKGSNKSIIKYTSPYMKNRQKPRKMLSTKEFFTPKTKKKYFNIDKKFSKKSSKKLSTTNTKIFRELIRKSIVKRQNKEERFKAIIKCLTTNINTRTNEDIKLIKGIIKDNKIASHLIIDKFNVENENLIQALSYEMEYRYLFKNQKLFEISDQADNIYLIIKGRVELYEFVEYKIDMPLYKYMLYIYNLNNNIIEKENNFDLYKLKKDIEENSEIIDILYDEIPFFICLLAKIKLSNMINTNFYNIFSEDLEQMITDCKNDPKVNLQNFDYDKERKNDDIYIKNIINDLNKKIPKVPKDLMDKYYTILTNNDDNFYTFKRYNFKKVRELKDGDFLGENTIDKNAKRKASVFALEETHLCYIDYDLYSEIINKFKEKLRDKEAKFLKESFYFSRISLQYFIKNYFSDFSYQELTHGNNILMENQSFENLYFLKEGIIEIYSNKSIIGLINLIKILSQKLKKSGEEIKNELLNISNNLYLYGKINKNYTLSTTSRLLIIANNDIIGIESWITSYPYFYNCKVISDKAKFYRISAKKIDELLTDIKETKDQLLNDSNKRLELLCKRIIKIINTRIQYYNKYNFYCETEKKIFNPDIIIKETNNLLFKKKMISANRIKELLNMKIQKLKEKEKECNHQHSTKIFNLTFINSKNRKNNFINFREINFSEERKLAKTQYLNSKNQDFSIRNLLLKKEKEKYEYKNKNKNKNLKNKLKNPNIEHMNSEKSLNPKELFDNNEKVISKKIYTIKGELKILNSLNNVLEGELLLSHNKKYTKTLNKNIMTEYERTNIRKSKTHTIHHMPFEDELNNEINTYSHSRRMSINTDVNLNNLILNSNTNFKLDNINYEINNKIINRRFSIKNKTAKNNINMNSFKGIKSRLNLIDNNNIIQFFNSKQKSLKLFNPTKDNIINHNYKTKLKENKYCLTERDKYKKKIYKIFQQKIKEPNYFLGPINLD